MSGEGLSVEAERVGCRGWGSVGSPSPEGGWRHCRGVSAPGCKVLLWPCCEAEALTLLERAVPPR